MSTESAAVLTLRATILIVEDEPAMQRTLRIALADQGYDCRQATTGQEGLSLVKERPPNLVILDLGLPDLDGMEVAARIRERSNVPIVVLSARSDESDIVEALDKGANDFLAKPFRERELFARIRAALRTASPVSGEALECGGIRVDPSRRQVQIRGQTVKLSATEYKLISVLVRAGGTVVTHAMLLQQVWGSAYVNEVGYLRVYMRHLREKLEPDPARPKYLLTEPGVGYRIEGEEGD